jgi:predicted nucleic acid-binding Zn ribbon protein
MMGHPYAQGWRAIMTAERRRNKRRIMFAVGGIAALLAPGMDLVIRWAF